MSCTVSGVVSSLLAPVLTYCCRCSAQPVGMLECRLVCSEGVEHHLCLDAVVVDVRHFARKLSV